MRTAGRLAGAIVLAITMTLAGATRAEALTTLSLVFTGSAVVGNCAGMGYPVLTGTPTVPPVTTVWTHPHPQIETYWGGPTCSFAIIGTSCLGTEATLKAAPVVRPLCTITASGWETGFCGFFSGRVLGTLMFGTDPSAPIFDFDLVYSSVTEKWTGTGSVTKRTTGQSGTFVMEVMTKRPDFVSTPAGGNCINGTATIWDALGTATATLT
jgi:hypothetical protein